MEITDCGVQCTECGNVLTGNIDIPRSPVPTLLTTNDAPSEIDSRVIHDKISTVRDNVLQLDADIERTQLLLEHLRQRRNAAHQFIDEHKGLTSPLRRFPPEILFEIFRNCLPKKNDRYNYFSVTRAPWVLLQICRLWRDVAASCTQLWSDFSFGFRRGIRPSDVAFAESWMSRADRLPLSISLWGQGFSRFELEDVDLSHFLDVVASRCDRWKHIEISVPSHIITPRALHAMVRRLDASEACMPLLHSINVRSPSAMPVDTFLIFLHLSPNILDCTVCLSSNSEATSPLPYVQLSRLRSLGINLPPPDIAILYDKLVLPALQSLSLYDTGLVHFGPSWPQIQFASFLLRSACSLRQLSLTGVLISERDLIECLQILPALTDLSYAPGVTGVAGDIWLRLTYLRVRDCLCPRLQSISFYRMEYPHFNINAYADMVQSRWMLDFVSDTVHDGLGTRISRLRELHLDFIPEEVDYDSEEEEDYVAKIDIGSSIIQRFNRFRDEGLKISISHNYTSLL